VEPDQVNASQLVTAFYERIWNAGDFTAVPELLTETFVFRGSLGKELVGRAEFEGYARSVRTALSDYRCEILEYVASDDKAFAKMRFSGIHVAEFRGQRPTGKRVHWLGAALFRFADGAIADLWVLGDLQGLDALLRNNKET
jgi:predicted ester cyclase